MDFDALRASTLPGLLVERERARPQRVAFRAKELGVWRETTWREFAMLLVCPWGLFGTCEELERVRCEGRADQVIE